MARRSYKNKTRTLQPAVMKLHFAAPVNSTNFVSISHSVSRLNRRFYRQGLNWAVANVRVTIQPAQAASVGSSCYVNSIPHTWSVANSWQKSFSAWKRQQDEAIAESGSESAVAAFRDFKISADIDHIVGSDLSPISMGPGVTAGPYPPGLIVGQSIDPSGEWEASEIVIPNAGPDATGTVNQPLEYLLHMVGPDTVTSKGLISGYQNSRSYPQSPDPVSPAIGAWDNWMGNMFDVGGDQSDVVVNATDRNDELPYDQTEYPGGPVNFTSLETQGYVLNQSTVGMNTYNTGPFTAPCGIIRFDFHDQAPGELLNNIITVELVPGKHRGYLAETMEEF